MSNVRTYDPKKVIISFGGLTLTGLAEDGFVQVESQGDGITAIVGCDQEVVRSIDPSNILKNITVALLQSSDCNDKLSVIQDSDNQAGNGIMAMSIKDLSGRSLMISDQAWIVKKPPLARGRSASSGTAQWVFQAVCPDEAFLIGGHT